MGISVMRTATFILSGLVGIVWVALIGTAFVTNSAPRTLTSVAYTIIWVLPALAFSIPAFILACLGRAPITGLILAILGVPLMIASAFIL